MDVNKQYLIFFSEVIELHVSSHSGHIFMVTFYRCVDLIVLSIFHYISNGFRACGFYHLVQNYSS